MAFFTWDEKYSVGIKMIDSQHKQLFELISRFYEAICQKEAKRGMSEALQGLVDYTKTHFMTEEAYMLKYDYPLYKGHKLEHDIFIEKVAGFQTRFQEGRLLIPAELANFFRDWLSKHILVKDQDYAPFLHKKI